MNSLAEKLQSKKGITIEDITSVVNRVIAPLMEKLDKVIMLLSIVDNKLSTNKVSSPSPSPSPGGFVLCEKARTLLNDASSFIKIANKIYHAAMAFEAFKSNMYTSMKENGIDVRKVIPSLKSKEVWKAIEEQWEKPTKKVLDVTPIITLTDTLKESGVDMKKVKEVIEYFSDLVEPEMFSDSGILNHEEWKTISKETGIDYSKKNANLESKVRSYISSLLKNAMVQ